MSRPTKLTEQTADLICASIRSGATMDEAAAVAGIARGVIYQWLKIGEAADEHRDRLRRRVRHDVMQVFKETPHTERSLAFTDKVREARASFTIEHGDNIVTAALRGATEETTVIRQQRLDNGDIIQLEVRRIRIPPDAKASMWLLERLHPHRFGRIQRVELAGPDGGEIPIPTDVLRDELLAKIEALHGRAESPPLSDDVVDTEVVDDVLSISASATH